MTIFLKGGGNITQHNTGHQKFSDQVSACSLQASGHLGPPGAIPCSLKIKLFLTSHTQMLEPLIYKPVG